MTRFIVGVLFALLSTVLGAAERSSESAVVFGKIRLGGKEVLPLAYRLTLREIDTGKLERLTLHGRDNFIYDFAEKIPAGKYHMYQMVAPNYNVDYLISDKKAAFEVAPGGTVYLGTWTLVLGLPHTTYKVDYDMDEIGVFSKANPGREVGSFSIGVPGKPSIPLKTQ